MLYHFSEDPGIERFVPHVPATHPGHPPAVWAIDVEHAPLYWFPRDCPRAAVWVSVDHAHEMPRRVHTVERAWEERLRTTAVFRYELPDEPFNPWPEADGQFIATETVVPKRVEPLGDLVALHQAAGIELRFVENLWPTIDWIVASGLPFSIVRKHLAQPPLTQPRPAQPPLAQPPSPSRDRRGQHAQHPGAQRATPGDAHSAGYS